jgi:hypothetical protein
LFPFISYNKGRVYKSAIIAVIMDKDLVQKPPYKDHLGEIVEVVMQGRIEVGRYQGKTEEGDLVLRPFLRMRDSPLTGSRRKNDEEKPPVYEWAKSRMYVQHNAVLVVFRPNAEDMRNIIKKHLPNISTG